MPEKIICKSCNTQNPGENIFCSKCGKKLESEENYVNKSSSASKIILRLIILIFFLIILGIGYFIIYPVITARTPVMLKGKELMIAGNKLRSIEFKKEGEYKFSPAEATSLYNSYIIDKRLKDNPLNITINENNLTSITIPIILNEWFSHPIPVTLTGYPKFVQIDMENNMFSGFEVKNVKIGNLSIPKSCYHYFLPYFDPYYNHRAKSIMKKIANINSNISDGFTVIVKTKNDINNIFRWK